MKTDLEISIRNSIISYVKTIQQQNQELERLLSNKETELTSMVEKTKTRNKSEKLNLEIAVLDNFREIKEKQRTIELSVDNLLNYVMEYL